MKRYGLLTSILIITICLLFTGCHKDENQGSTPESTAPAVTTEEKSSENETVITTSSEDVTTATIVSTESETISTDTSEETILQSTMGVEEETEIELDEGYGSGGM